jgi:hypothetical protein
VASVPKFVAAGTADVQGHAARCKLAGFSWQATVAGVVVLRDGTGTGDPAIITIQMGANASAVETLPDVMFSTGIFVDRDGTVNNSLTLFLAQGV